MHYKKDGFVLWVVLIIGAVILSMGAALIVLVTKDLAIVRSAVQASEAYYTAESGIELALQALHKDDAEAVLGYRYQPTAATEGMVDILNNAQLQDEDVVEYTLPAFRNCIRVPYAIDQNTEELITERQKPQIVSLRVMPDAGVGRLYWALQCPYDADGDDRSEQVTLEGVVDITGDVLLDVPTLTGRYSPPLVTEPQENITITELIHTRLPMSLRETDQTACIFTLQNAAEAGLRITATGDVPPYEVPIIATGQAQGSTKRLRLLFPRRTEENCVLQNNLFTE